MARRTATSCLLLLSVGTLVSSAEITAAARGASVAPAPVPALSYHLQEVAGGVFCAVASGVPYYVANSVVVLGQDGVLAVDSGAGPNEARVLLATVRTISDRPVRWVIDTHFHFDHAFGNEAFPARRSSPTRRRASCSATAGGRSPDTSRVCPRRSRRRAATPSRPRRPSRSTRRSSPRSFRGGRISPSATA